jgi:hypothetical protein
MSDTSTAAFGRLITKTASSTTSFGVASGSHLGFNTAGPSSNTTYETGVAYPRYIYVANGGTYQITVHMVLQSPSTEAAFDVRINDVTLETFGGTGQLHGSTIVALQAGDSVSLFNVGTANSLTFANTAAGALITSASLDVMRIA